MQLHPFYVLRRPLLPIGIYFQLQERLSQGHALADILRDGYQHSLAQQALYFASGDVYEQCQQWLAGSLVPSDKLLRTLYRYLVRMTTRATPFGLCSGVSLGEWGRQSGVRFNDQQPVRTHLRLDALALQQVLNFVSQLPEVQPTVRYRANTTTYAVRNELRYVEANQAGGLPGSYALSATDNTEYVHCLLSTARLGKPIQELIDLLTNEGIDAQDARPFIEALIDNQLLQSEFDPSLTVHNELKRLLDRLRPFPELQHIADLLIDVQVTLQTADSTYRVAECQRLAEKLAPLINIDNRPLVQCDTYFPTKQNTVGEAIRQQLNATLQQLLQLGTASQTHMATFRQQFYERYEEQEIPLLLALDPDIGIGYSSSSLTATLIDAIDWPKQEADEVTFTKKHQVILRLFTETLRRGYSEIDLSEEDLASLTTEQPAPVLPASGYWMGHLLASSAEALDAGDWTFYLVVGGGPSAANLLGRMAHLDEGLRTHLQTAIEEEEESVTDAVWAEIVHLPEAWLANVLTRPVLRNYEIPILSVSGVDDAHQLPLDDLLISVPRGQQIILRSRRLGKRVIPRLSTAHNFLTGLAHYQFLCDLQRQEGSLRINWDWGPLASQPYLPQVRYKNVILSRARWQLTSAIVPLKQADWLVRWREEYRVPRYVVLLNADNELPLDLDNQLSRNLLADELAKTGAVKLNEWLLNEQTCWAGQDGSRFVSELILPATFATTSAPLRAAKQVDLSVQRLFAPGSEWVYLRIFSGEQAGEQLLLSELPVLLDELRAAGYLKQWFYIRYNQPEPQLRVRFQSSPDQESQLVLAVLAWVQGLTATQGTLYRIHLDTYQREIERYGASRIELCEAWFCLESDRMLPILQLIAQEGESSRLFYACALVDRLLAAWQMPVSQRDDLIERLRASFSREFKADTALIVQLDKRYRLFRSVVHEALTAFEAPPSLTHYDPLFHKLAEQLQPTLIDQQQQDDLLASLIHMLLNRIFLTEHRRHEYLVYHLLRKEYVSLLKRKPSAR